MALNEYLHQKIIPLLPAIKTTIKNWAVILFGLLMHSGLSAVTLIFVARQVQSETYGLYLASYSLVSFLVIMPGFGMDAWLLTQSGEPVEEPAYKWLRALSIRIQLLLLWAIGMLLVGTLLPRQSFPYVILIPTIIGLAFDSITTLCYASLRTKNRHHFVTILQSIASISLFCLTLLLPDRENFIQLFSVSRMILSIIVSLIILKLSGGFQLGRFFTYFTKSKDIFTSARPFMYSEVAASVYARADVTLISLVLGAAFTGVYGPAINILQAAALSSRALFFFTLPILSRIFKRNQVLYIKYGIWQLVLQIITGTAVALFVYFFSSEIINFIFHDDYAPSIEILRIFSPIPFFRSINFGLATLLASGNMQLQRTKVQLITSVFNITGNIIVILPFGLIGVAMIYVFSELFLVMGYTILTFRMLKNLRLQA